MKTLGKVGVIGRFKPLHSGGALMLETICQRADHVIIGIGSSNKYNLRNPFTAKESQGMLDAFLSSLHTNYNVVHVPDFAQDPHYRDGQQWKEYVKTQFGPLDYFFTGNLYVKTLLEDSYHVAHPAQFIPQDRRIKLRATEVRLEMARGNEWKNLVPPKVVSYLEQQDLISRFRQEFGSAILESKTDPTEYRRSETIVEELLHAREP